MEYALTKIYALRLNLFFSINGFTKRHGSEKCKHTHVHPHSLIYLYKYTCEFYALYNYTTGTKILM